MSDAPIIETFELSDGEKSHPLWVRLKAHLETQLQSVRERNDRVQPEMETAALRGQIRCLRSIISLGDDRPSVE